MILFAVADETWIVLAGMFFATLINIATIIFSKKDTNSAIADNTKISVEAAINARAAKHIGHEVLQEARSAASKAESAVEEFKQIQSDSGMLRRMDHFKGGESPKPKG